MGQHCVRVRDLSLYQYSGYPRFFGNTCREMKGTQQKHISGDRTWGAWDAAPILIVLQKENLQPKQQELPLQKPEPRVAAQTSATVGAWSLCHLGCVGLWEAECIVQGQTTCPAKDQGSPFVKARSQENPKVDRIFLWSWGEMGLLLSPSGVLP